MRDVNVLEKLNRKLRFFNHHFFIRSRAILFPFLKLKNGITSGTEFNIF